MFDQIDFEYADSLARQALDHMSKHKVPASPDNFAIWFQYAARSDSNLSKTIDVLIGNRKPFTEQTNRDLVRLFILGDQQAAMSEKVRELVHGARNLLAGAIDDQSAQISKLEHVATQASQHDPKSLLAVLLDELLNANTRAAKLEASFSKTCQELDQVKETLARADQSAKTDALTGLANRRGLDERLKASQMRAMESGKPLTILLLDIDHFKRFNDKYGHQVGDQVLRLVASVFKEHLREEDFPARYGGEEMFAILEDTSLGVGKTTAERIRCKIAERKMHKRSTGEDLGLITASIGLAEFRAGETLGEMVERADRALYQAKRTGRNRTVTELELDADIAAA